MLPLTAQPVAVLLLDSKLCQAAAAAAEAAAAGDHALLTS
jgi:hypothetical protein